MQRIHNKSTIEAALRKGDWRKLRHITAAIRSPNSTTIKSLLGEGEQNDADPGKMTSHHIRAVELDTGTKKVQEEAGVEVVYECTTNPVEKEQRFIKQEIVVEESMDNMKDCFCPTEFHI